MKEVLEVHQLRVGWERHVLRTDDDKDVACCGPSAARTGKWFVIAWKPDSLDRKLYVRSHHVRSYADSEEEAIQMMHALAVQTRLDHA